MEEKPRNPRRQAGGVRQRPVRAPRSGRPGERPATAGRPAGKPGKDPAGPRIAGVDAQTFEILEREGLLSGEGRKLRDAAIGTKKATDRKAAPANRSSEGGERRAPARLGGRPGKAPARVAERTGPTVAGRGGRARRLDEVESMVGQRLQKVMAHSGVASRRHSEELIQAGRVTVNGNVVTELGTKIVPGRDIVEVDGRALGRTESLAYIVVYKPKGYVTTLFDPQGRNKVTDLLGGEVGERVYPVGRLDFDTEGLLLLTNDGELANALMHPARQVKKTYIAKVRGVPGPAKLKALESGIELDDGETAPAEVKMIDVRAPNSATVSIRIHEGRNRQVRRMFEAVGHEVIHLKRTTLGPLTLKGLEVGQWRELSVQEILDLRASAGIRAPKAAVAAALYEERKGVGQRNLRRGGGRTEPKGELVAAPVMAPRTGSRPVGRPAGRLTERPAGRPTERSAGRPTERSAGRPTERSAGRPSERSAGFPMERSTGRPSERSAGFPTERPGGRPTERSPGRPTERSGERPAAGRPVGRPSSRSGKPDHRKKWSPK